MGFRNRNRERTKAANQFFGGGGFDSNAITYFTAVGLTDPAYTVPINQFIMDLKAASLWSKFDRLWILATANAAVALTCIKSLEVMTPVNGPTFTAGQGYAGNGSTSYLNTNFVPSADGVSYTRDSAAAGYYCRTNPGGIGSWYDMGAVAPSSGAQLTVIARYYDDTAYASINNTAGSFVTVSSSNSIGLWLLSRTGGGALKYYRNGSPIVIGSTTSIDVPTNEVLLCGNNSGGNAGTPNASACTPRQYAMAWFSSGFNDIEAANFNICVSTLRATIGF